MAASNLRVYLGLGTNLGARSRNLRAALALLDVSITVEAVSAVYESEPVGVTDQPLFFNLVAACSTSLPPVDLLDLVKSVERKVGRTPTFRWGPRVVDIDILLYGSTVVNLANLVIPHPELLQRAFVLRPLCELAPTVALPSGHPICPPESPAIAAQIVRRLGPLSQLDA